MSGINKLLLHTTESTGWPSYPSFAPTLTYDPWRHSWRQHMPILGSASTLSNAGSYQTNRAEVCQIEIVGFADESMGARYNKFIGDIDEQASEDLGAFAVWLHEHYGLQLDCDVTFKAYNDGRHPSSYGYDNGVRLSVSQYENYRGVLGHMHAPGNNHGDPGSLQIEDIMNAARGGAAPPDDDSDHDGEEEANVSRFVRYRGEDQHLAGSDEWQTLKVDQDEEPGAPYDIVEGPTNVQSLVLRFVADGINQDDDLFFRPYTVDKYQGQNERQNVGPELKIEGPRRGWLRDQRAFTWNLGGGPDTSKGRVLRFDWKCSNWKAVLKEIEVSGYEDRN